MMLLDAASPRLVAADQTTNIHSVGFAAAAPACASDTMHDALVRERQPFLSESE